jgi:hypothetical protein
MDKMASLSSRLVAPAGDRCKPPIPSPLDLPAPPLPSAAIGASHRASPRGAGGGHDFSRALGGDSWGILGRRRCVLAAVVQLGD